MARVVIGRVGEDVVLGADVCVTSGVLTNQRIIMRGSTTPGWVHLLLIFTIIGWIFAQSMASTRFRAEVPFLHARHDLWRRGYRVAWALGLAGVGGAIAGSFAGIEYAGMCLWATLAAVLFGIGNGLLTTVGFTQGHGGELVMTRVHPDAAAAIRRARVEALQGI